MLIAIDHGNYAVKTPHFSFISGLTEHTVKPPMAEEVLEYNGKYWSLTGQRLPYMRDKTRDDRYFILSLFAIAKELSAAGANTAFEQIDLAVGLPPEHYGMWLTAPPPVRVMVTETPRSVSSFSSRFPRSRVNACS